MYELDIKNIIKLGCVCEDELDGYFSLTLVVLLNDIRFSVNSLLFVVFLMIIY